MSDEIDWTKMRGRMKEFIEQVVYPLEQGFDKDTPESQAALAAVQQQAKDAGLWALGHPKDVGGQGMPFMDYVHVNEVIGRSNQLPLNMRPRLGALPLKRRLVRVDVIKDICVVVAEIRISDRR